MNNRLKWAAFALALAACAGVAFLKSGVMPSGSGAPPKGALRLIPDAVDFGEIELNQKRIKTVEVHNTGRTPVSITGVIPGCSCLSASISRSVIPPGEKADLTLVFTGLPGKRSYLTNTMVVSDESGPSGYEAKVGARILQEFVLKPDVLQFGRLKRGESKSLNAIVKRVDGQRFRIDDIRASAGDVRFDWKPLVQGDETAYRVTATVEAATPGFVAESVALSMADHGSTSAPRLTVEFEIQGRHQFSPGVAIGRPTADGKFTQFEATLRDDEKRSPQIVEIRDLRNQPVEYSVQPEATGGCRLTIKRPWSASEVRLGEFRVVIAAVGETLRLPYRIEAGSTR